MESECVPVLPRATQKQGAKEPAMKSSGTIVRACVRACEKIGSGLLLPDIYQVFS